MACDDIYRPIVYLHIIKYVKTHNHFSWRQELWKSCGSGICYRYSNIEPFLIKFFNKPPTKGSL